jgi:hypothetical protein
MKRSAFAILLPRWAGRSTRPPRVREELSTLLPVFVVPP